MARPTTALIVDDEPHVRAFVRLLLDEVGITTCWEASDGAGAIAALEQHQPELVMLDINLPVLGGLQVLRELQAAGWDTPVIILTAESALKTVQESARLGARGYLLKQSPRAEAVATLRELLDELADGDADGAGD